ncbi:MAG: HD domain-containing protein [Lautropia sp.]|nr:HD domain-containing protein [Lautropia sp.]
MSNRYASSAALLTLDDIEALFTRRGGERYSGEPVTQREHALQTAYLAERGGGDDELVTASLLHDLGHLLHDGGSSPTLRGADDRHQYYAVPFLRAAFSQRVLRSIALHVDAKRYLCRTRAAYWAALSEDSKRSLVLQGGVFSEEEADRFIDQAYAADAVQVRLWDDLAKTPDLATPPLEHYLAYARRCLRSGSRAG